MLNWFMELTSLKNLSHCEKGSWLKSPAASLSPQTQWGASSGLGCDWEVAGQPLEGKGFLGAAAASWVRGQDGFAPGRPSAESICNFGRSERSCTGSRNQKERSMRNGN